MRKNVTEIENGISFRPNTIYSQKEFQVVTRGKVRELIFQVVFVILVVKNSNLKYNDLKLSHKSNLVLQIDINCSKNLRNTCEKYTNGCCSWN